MLQTSSVWYDKIVFSICYIPWWGFLNESFGHGLGLGDLLELSDNEDGPAPPPIGPGGPNAGDDDNNNGEGELCPKVTWKVKTMKRKVFPNLRKHAYKNFFTVAISVAVEGPKKPKSNPFPDIEGQESANELVAKYKRACIQRKTAHKELQDKFDKEQPSTGKTLLLTKQTFCANSAMLENMFSMSWKVFG